METFDAIHAGRALLLIMVANVLPWAAGRALPHHWNAPLDCGLRLRDGRRLLGDHKTWRGLLVGTLGCGLTAMLTGPGLAIGAGFGALSLTGDALSSALKRRLRLPPGTEIAGLDQLPEALLPSLVFAGALELGLVEITASALAFLALDVLVTGVRQGSSARTRDRGEG